LATKRFKAIAEAHEVLRDGQLRQLYDLYLEYRPRGYVEVEDHEDPNRSFMPVPFKGWADFRRMFEHGFHAPDDARQDSAAEPDADPDDPPLSITEWLVAGAVLLTVWCISCSRHNHRQWLRCLPADIFYTHVEYSIPMGLFMSPFFFANLAWKDAAQWMRAMVDEAYELS